MCIDAPESTTNSLSSGFRVDASRHLFSEGEKNVALWCSFNFNTFLASFHAASRAPCSCHSVSSCDRSSIFGALGQRTRRTPGQKKNERGILVSNFGMTCNSFCELHTLDWLRHVGALPDNRLRRRHVLKYATQLPCIRRLTFRRLLSQLFITSLPRFPRSIVTSIGDRFSFLPISLFNIATALLSLFVLDLFVCCSST